MKHWLIGGIIFSILSALFFSSLAIIEFNQKYKTNGTMSQAGVFMTGGADCRPAAWLGNSLEIYIGEKIYNDSSCQRIVFTSITAVLFLSFISFLIGSFIGSIYAKIRKR